MSTFTEYLRTRLAGYKSNVWFRTSTTASVVNLLDDVISQAENAGEDDILLNACKFALERLRERGVAPTLKGILSDLVEKIQYQQIELMHSNLMAQFLVFFKQLQIAIDAAVSAISLTEEECIVIERSPPRIENGRIVVEAHVRAVNSLCGSSRQIASFEKRVAFSSRANVSEALRALSIHQTNFLPSSSSSSNENPLIRFTGGNIKLPVYNPVPRFESRYKIECNGSGKLLWESGVPLSCGNAVHSVSGKALSSNSTFSLSYQGSGLFKVICVGSNRMLRESCSSHESRNSDTVFRGYTVHDVANEDDGYTNWKMDHKNNGTVTFSLDTSRRRLMESYKSVENGYEVAAVEIEGDNSYAQWKLKPT